MENTMKDTGAVDTTGAFTRARGPVDAMAQLRVRRLLSPVAAPFQGRTLPIAGYTPKHSTDVVTSLAGRPPV